LLIRCFNGNHLDATANDALTGHLRKRVRPVRSGFSAVRLPDGNLRLLGPTVAAVTTADRGRRSTMVVGFLPRPSQSTPVGRTARPTHPDRHRVVAGRVFLQRAPPRPVSWPHPDRPRGRVKVAVFACRFAGPACPASPARQRAAPTRVSADADFTARPDPVLPPRSRRLLRDQTLGPNGGTTGGPDAVVAENGGVLRAAAPVDRCPPRFPRRKTSPSTGRPVPRFYPAGTRLQGASVGTRVASLKVGWRPGHNALPAPSRFPRGPPSNAAPHEFDYGATPPKEICRFISVAGPRPLPRGPAGQPAALTCHPPRGPLIAGGPLAGARSIVLGCDGWVRIARLWPHRNASPIRPGWPLVFSPAKLAKRSSGGLGTGS